MAEREPLPQSVTSAWVNYLRREVYDYPGRDLARLAHIGVWMATYANADGTSVTVGRETLAKLCGVSQETVSRALRVFEGIGMVRSRRRPNANAEKILTIPSERPDWKTWLPVFTETRQRAAHRSKKDREMQELLAAEDVSDSVRGRHPDSVRGCVPDSVRGGGSGQRPWTPSEVPDSVRGRPRTASVDAVRTASVAGGTSTYLPPVATSTEDQGTPPLSPRQPVRAGARGTDNDPEPERGKWIECPGCGGRMLPRPGRSVCTACIRDGIAAEPEAAPEG